MSQIAHPYFWMLRIKVTKFEYLVILPIDITRPIKQTFSNQKLNNELGK